MRAIVTGGYGFIGSHLVDALLFDGWNVVIVDDGRNGTSPPPFRDRVEIYHRPVYEQHGLGFDHYGTDVVFHLAAPVGPVGVIAEAGSIVPEVIEASEVVAGWALDNGCPLIDVSTSEVYGSGHADTEDAPCIFQADTSARKEYAIGKLAAETMLLNTPGLDVRIVRPFNVAGPRQLPDGGFVLPRFVGQALSGHSLTVYAPGTQRRAFTHVEDIVSGILAVYDRGRAGEVYNLGNAANEVAIRQLADEVIAATGSHSRVSIVDPTALHGPGFREAPDKIPDATKAARELGWAPRWDRAAMIEAVVAYWRMAMVA